MTIMTAAPPTAPWCPHPSWLVYYATWDDNEATYYVHCERCGEPWEIRVEAA